MILALTSLQGQLRGPRRHWGEVVGRNKKKVRDMEGEEGSPRHWGLVEFQLVPSQKTVRLPDITEPWSHLNLGGRGLLGGTWSNILCL